MNEEEQAFHYLLDEYMQIPKQWEDYQIIKNAIKKNKQLQNNWNELKKSIEDVLKTTYEKWGRNCANEFDLGCLEIKMTMNNYGEILSKMQELEGKNE